MENKKAKDQNPEKNQHPEENIRTEENASQEIMPEENKLHAGPEDTGSEEATPPSENTADESKASVPEPEISPADADQPMPQAEKEAVPEAEAEAEDTGSPGKGETAADPPSESAAPEPPVSDTGEAGVAEPPDEEKPAVEAEAAEPPDEENPAVEAEAAKPADEEKPAAEAEITAEEAAAPETPEETAEAEKPASEPEGEKEDVDVKEEAAEEEDEDKEDDHDGNDGDEEDDDNDEPYEEYNAGELVAKLEELVTNEDVMAIKSRVALIKVAYLKSRKEEKQAALDKFLEEGGEEAEFSEEENKLDERFNQAFDKYRQNKARYNERLEQVKLDNLRKKKDILEKLKELIGSEESLKKTYDEFRALQAEWKEIGVVPTGEVSMLWQNYHFLVEKFFDKVKINKELRDLDMKKNLELKINLCEKVEELLLESSIIKSFKELQKYHEEWKETGPVPQSQSDEIWERFKAATDKINERRREHYEQLQQEQEKNLLAKTNLCEQAEELAAVIPDNMKGWQQQTAKINELFKLWRSIGRAPKKQNTEIWERFKGSLNAFFANKKEFLNSIKQEQLNNYNLKVDLCVQAENVRDSSDWKQTTQELIRLQQEWKKIGPVPKKHSDKIWKRFRAACDEFFNNKSAHFSNVHENEQENLDRKLALIEKIEKFEFEEDKSRNLDILKGFQREWIEIGFVPMKEKERIQKQFREAIDARLNELKISATELSKASYESRMDALKDSPDAGRVYRKEITFLNNRISQMRDDVILWENNLGFFANSKKADILKREFELKIEKAKQELAAMEAKVKYLRKMSAG
jgi:hypothetical protein